jgi:hypothetical protein
LLLRMNLGVLLLLVTWRASAINEARLLHKSQSGHTVLFNLGVHDGIKEGEYAVVVKQIRDLDERNLRVVPVARARNVKINPESSVWILFQVMQPDLLREKDPYLVLTESALLSGRRDRRFGRLKVVEETELIDEAVERALQHDADRLSKLKDRYEAVTPLHGPEVRDDHDATLIDLEEWKPVKEDRHRAAVYTSPHKDEFGRSLQLSTFDKLVTAYLKKVNDPNFTYDAFYHEQMRDAFSNEFRSRSNFDTAYEGFLRDQATQGTADARLYRSLLEKGEGWSEDFSDEELRLMLGRVSVLQEKDRRRQVVHTPLRYALALDYGRSLTDAQSNEDLMARRDSRFSFEGEFEVTPFIRHDVLERFTLHGGFRGNWTAMETRRYNAIVNEYTAAMGANWYPWYAPYVIEAPVIFMGAYFRSGFARMEAPTANEQGNYTVLAIPGLRLGLKYFLRNRFGLRIILSMETLRMDRYEASRYTTVALPETTYLIEGKFGLGLTYLF